MSQNTPTNPFAYGPYVLPISPGPLATPFTNASGVVLLSTSGANEVNNHTLQNLIEVSYIKTANEVLYQGFNGLNRAITNTTNTLNTLTKIQNLHNAIYTKSLDPLPFDYTSDYGSIEDYQEEYNRLASAYYGQPIIPDFIFLSEDAEGLNATGQLLYSNFDAYSKELGDARAQLSDNVAALSAQMSSADRANPNSLYATAKKVLSQLPPSSGDGPNYVDAKLWVLDGYSINNGEDLAQSHPDSVSGFTGRITSDGEIINPLDSDGDLVNPLGSGYLGSPSHRETPQLQEIFKQILRLRSPLRSHLTTRRRKKFNSFCSFSNNTTHQLLQC